MGRAVIVTAIPVEFEMVLSSPSLSNWKTDKQLGSIYKRGKFSETSWEVLLVRSGKGNIASALATERALQYFRPDVAFFVGVAGSIKDARRGDVVIANEVLYYEFVKVGEEEKIQVRPSGFHCSFNLVEIAHDIAQTKKWLERLGNIAPWDAPKAFIGTIASGEAVIASKSADLYKFLRNNYNQAIAVEMEGYGFLEACDAHICDDSKGIPGLVVRGISDLLSGKENADAGGSQELAARNATAFALQVLAQLRKGVEYPDKVINVPELPVDYLSRGSDYRKVKNALLSKKKKTVGIRGQKVVLKGMGGIGKTVLAAALARDSEVRTHFSDGVFWLALGQKPNLVNRQLQLARDLGELKRQIVDVQDGRSCLSGLLADKACLIILDDVWDAQHIDAFNILGPRCRMMITTRKAWLLRGEFEHNLDVLKDKEALELLARRAGQKQDDLPVEAQEVAKECGNLPLALAMVGVMVRSRPERWTAVLHRLRNADLSKIKANFADYPYPNLFRAIEASVEDLAQEDKDHYLDLAVFPEDMPVPKATLETFWGPDGLDVEDVSDLIYEFVDRSLARMDMNKLTLHELQCDYVRKRASDLKALHGRLLDAYDRKKGHKRLWHNLPDDGYIHFHLIRHLHGADRLDEIHILLREETLEGRNARYETWENLNQPANFINEVAEAWRFAEEKTKEMIRKNETAWTMGLEIRYALITSSINTLAENISPMLLYALVDREIMTPAQALTYALQIPKPDMKARSLIKLIPFLSVEQQEDVKRKAEKARPGIISMDDAESYSDLFPHLQKGRQDEELDEAVIRAEKIKKAKTLTVVCTIQDQDPREKALDVLQKCIKNLQRDACSLEDNAASVLNMNASEKLTPFDAYIRWKDRLRSKSALNREGFLDSLCEVASITSILGGKDALDEAIRAIKDVGRWWP